MPTLTQGLSNLVLVPLALAIGRRPVYLFANTVFLLAVILAANCQNYSQHLAYRLMMGCSVGVGQSLVPLMVTESFFLHQRATCLSYSGAINSLFGLVWGMFVPNVVGAIGWRNLYYVVSDYTCASTQLSDGTLLGCRYRWCRIPMRHLPHARDAIQPTPRGF